MSLILNINHTVQFQTSDNRQVGLRSDYSRSTGSGLTYMYEAHVKFAYSKARIGKNKKTACRRPYLHNALPRLRRMLRLGVCIFFSYLQLLHLSNILSTLLSLLFCMFYSLCLHFFKYFLVWLLITDTVTLCAIIFIDRIYALEQ